MHGVASALYNVAIKELAAYIFSRTEVLAFGIEIVSVFKSKLTTPFYAIVNTSRKPQIVWTGFD